MGCWDGGENEIGRCGSFGCEERCGAVLDSDAGCSARTAPTCGGTNRREKRETERSMLNIMYNNSDLKDADSGFKECE